MRKVFGMIFAFLVIAGMLFSTPVAAQVGSSDPEVEMIGYASYDNEELVVVGVMKMDDPGMTPMLIEMGAESILGEGLVRPRKVVDRDLPTECQAYTGRKDGERVFTAMCDFDGDILIMISSMSDADTIEYLEMLIDDEEIVAPDGFVEIDMD